MLSPEEIVQLTELAKKYEAANTDAVHAIIQQHFHPVFQRINDGGRAAANQAAKEKIAELEGKVTTTEAKLLAVSADLKSLTDKTPDVAVLRREYEEKITKLEAEHKQQVTQRDALVAQGHKDRAVADLVASLTTEYGVDPEYARDVLAKKSDVVDRIRVADGKISVLQAGQQELTITPAEGRSPVSHFAEELAGKVSDKWKASSISERGPVAKGVAGQGLNKYDAIRAAAAAKPESVLVQNAGLARIQGRPIIADQ